MSCLILAFAALLALSIPAAIARSSLIGAYLVILVLTAIVAAALALRAHRRGGGEVVATIRTPLIRLVALAIGYGVVVTLVHVVK